MALWQRGLTFSLVPSEGEALSDEHWGERQGAIEPHLLVIPSLITSSGQPWPLSPLRLWSVGVAFLYSPYPRLKPISDNMP